MFFINLDVSPLVSFGQEIDAASKKAMEEAGKRLTIMTKAHIEEEAKKKLHTRRDMFIKGLSHFKVDDHTYVVNLDASVRWIDDGMPAHNMIDDLLKPGKGAKAKPPKRAKDGSMYRVIPFRHGPKGPTQMTPAQATLLNTIKKELKARDIPYGKLEGGGSGGGPKLGLLHKFDIKNSPIKTSNSPGQGKGAVGQVMQGPTGIPLLQGVRIYQRQVKNDDGSTSTRKDIMTFRIVSSKHKGQGRWDHPGNQALKLMDEAYDWAKKTWDKDIVPQLMLTVAKNF